MSFILRTLLWRINDDDDDDDDEKLRPVYTLQPVVTTGCNDRRATLTMSSIFCCRKIVEKSFLSENFGLFVAQKENYIWGQLTAKFVGKMRLSVGILSEISSVSEDCNFLPAYVF